MSAQGGQAQARRKPVTGALAALALGLIFLLLPVLAPVSSHDGAAHAQAQLATPDEVPPTIDYAAWETTATRIEAELERQVIPDQVLENLRGELVKWRAEFTRGQTANATRIATVREQIAALGPAPAEADGEAPELAARRAELAEQMGRLQAPGIAADEAYRRADGLIGEIDSKLRTRQADQLLQHWPSPLNPVNWPAAFDGFFGTLGTLASEFSTQWNAPVARDRLLTNLPLILGLIALAFGTAILGRRWVELFSDRLRAGSTEAKRRVFAFLASLGQVILPLIGMMALSSAFQMSAMTGSLSGALTRALPFLGVMFFTAMWIGRRLFPRDGIDSLPIPVPPERRREMRFLAMMIGLTEVLETVRIITIARGGYDQAVESAASFPVICLGGVVLWRIGTILAQLKDGDDPSYFVTVVALIGKLARIVGIAGPLLAAFGYVPAAQAVVFPSLVSLALMGLLLVLQRFLSDLWALVMRLPAGEDRDGLMPVMIGFLLILVAVPLFTLVWGARISDLTEVWTRFGAGFQIGEARISPGDFLIFGMIFALGYMATRLLQGTLRSTVLPRTKIDRGGQNALVAGAGYLGYFLSALIAINATGIDLSGLAIVASALSVGIGFGLQNIVQNFVSGIILMVERPVSEGDWIEVGATQGIVKSISVRSTRIQTFDRNVVVVPNADLVSQRVTNWTGFSLTGRAIIPVSVAAGSDTRLVEKILREIAEAQPMAILNPPPAVLFQGFTGDVMNFEIRVILRDVNFGGSVRTEVNHQIVARFREAGIAMPSTSAAIRLDNAEEIGRAFGHQPLPADRPVAMAKSDPALPAPEDAGTGDFGARATNTPETGKRR